MLAHDRCVLDIPLEERLQSRTSDLFAWTTTIFRLSATTSTATTALTPPPRQYQPSAERVPDLYSQAVSDSSKQEPSLQRLPPPHIASTEHVTDLCSHFASDFNNQGVQVATISSATTAPTTNTPVPALTYSQFTSDFNKQEPRSPRFHQIFAGSFLRAAAPVESIG
jgi:hypothetical protein